VIVADTNLIAYFLIPGPFTGQAEAVFDRDPLWAAPLLWRSELRNVLWQYVRSGQRPLAAAIHAMTAAEALLREREFGVESAPVLGLAASSNCSPYDCEFVHLAQTFDCPLVTSDKKLIATFPGTAVSPEDFVR
jgi:predicted nucleic acid-binding protein